MYFAGGSVRGVTLVEVIVAIGILGFVFSMILALVPLSHVVNRTSWDNNVARELANGQMEAMRAYPFDNMPSYYAPPALASGNWTENWQGRGGGGTDFKTTVYVTPYEGAHQVYPTSYVKLVTVSVQWNATGGPRSYVTQSVVAKRMP